jgi:nucleoside-diphosphate-sugar epimerase
MDFMYSVDVMKVVEHVLNNSPSSLPHRDYNLCYTEKIALFDIAQYIREITGHKGDLIIEDQQMGHPIIGNNTRLLEMNLSFCGLKAGIDEVYNQLKDSG